jgi:hypothetical protein
VNGNDDLERWKRIARNAALALQQDPNNARALEAFNAARPHLAAAREATSTAEQEAAGDPGFWAALGLGASQGATFGFGDEAAGALGAIGALVPGGQSPGEAYRAYRDRTREETHAAIAARPGAYIAGEIASAIPQVVVPVAAAARVPAAATQASRLAQAARLVGRSARTGAIVGGITGAGRSEASGRDLARDVGIGTALGAGVGAVVPIGYGVASLARRRLVDPIVRALSRAPSSGPVRPSVSPLSGLLGAGDDLGAVAARPVPPRPPQVVTDVAPPMAAPVAPPLAPPVGAPAVSGRPDLGLLVPASPTQTAGPAVRTASPRVPSSLANKSADEIAGVLRDQFALAQSLGQEVTPQMLEAALRQLGVKEAKWGAVLKALQSQAGLLAQ